jgi:hypothetical protein
VNLRGQWDRRNFFMLWTVHRSQEACELDKSIHFLWNNLQHVNSTRRISTIFRVGYLFGRPLGPAMPCHLTISLVWSSSRWLRSFTHACGAAKRSISCRLDIASIEHYLHITMLMASSIPLPLPTPHVDDIVIGIQHNLGKRWTMRLSPRSGTT